jgi:MYXO-CTERM domain-containing protein
VELLQGCDGKGNVIPFESNKCTPNTCNDTGDRCARHCPCSDAGWCSDAAVEAGPELDAGADGTDDGAGGAGGSTDGGTDGGAGGGASGAGGGGPYPDAGASSLHCEERRPNGLTCIEGRQCNSGFCVDGYCCNLACTGQCEACDVSGKYGFCTTVGKEKDEPPHVDGGSVDFGGTLKSRKACNGEGSGCVGFCNGIKTQECAYPGSEKVAKDPRCAEGDGGFITTSYSCDSDGGEVPTPSSCGGFRCNGMTACKTACASDDDCITDYVCLPQDAGPSTCQPLTGPLCDGKFTLRKPTADGGNTPCPDHYTCPAGATQCRTDCDSVNDCVDAFVCNSAHKCVPQLAAPPVPGCSCRTGAEGEPPVALTALAALALTAASRRRRRA